MKYANAIVRVALGATVALSLVASPATGADFTKSVKAGKVSEPTMSYSVAVSKKKKKWTCRNVLAERLHAAGFRGHNLREAWAIAMRESGGNPKSVSPTQDYGVFQFNRAAWHRADWWNPGKLLTAEYNIQVAYRISRGGKTWYPWDLTGKGHHMGRYTPASTYSAYKKWYAKYPCAV